MTAENTFVRHKKPWQYQEGKYTVTRGGAWTGPGCHDGCGVLLYTDQNQKLVKVEGDPDDPYNQGRLCVRCLDVPHVVNHPDRLLYPLKRAGERGENKWERISWDEALDTIAAKFIDIKDKYGAEAVVFNQGTGRDIVPYMSRLAWSYGSPNYTCTLSGFACFIPRISAMAATTGSFWVSDCAQNFADRYDNPEWEPPEHMILWGNNPVVSNADGFYGHWVIDLMKRGTKFITVDPRVTWLGSKSEHLLQLRPGTDAALALGMLNVIISEGLYDKAFVDKWCTGFEDLAERVKQYPVDRVSEITWVPAEKIVAAARAIGKSKRVALQWGVAVDMTKQSLPACQALSALFEITCNVDRPGTMIRPSSFLAVQSGWGWEFLGEEQNKKRIGLSKYPLLQYGFTCAHPDEVLFAMESGEPYPIKASWNQTNNFLACMAADPKRVIPIYKNLEFNVVVDLFMTPTAVALADIVLPAATFTERDGVLATTGSQRGGVINKVTSIGEAKSDMEINLLLGKRLRPEAWPWNNVVEMFDSMVGTQHMKFAELREKGPAYMPYEYLGHEKGLLRHDGQPGFNTPSGRIELESTFVQMIGLDPLPYYEEPEPGPVSSPEMYKEYPLILTTGARTWSMFHSEHRQIPHLRALHPDPIIQIHPEAALKYGVSEGDWVWVENHMGRAQRKVELTPVLDSRVVSTDHAWWRPEAEAAEPNLYDVWKLNINQLIPFAPGDSGFGANYKTLLCKIYKVEEGER